MPLLKLCSVFSGIGGLELGLEEAELNDRIEVVQFVECNPYCQQVLRRHWPNTPIWEDILTYNPLFGEFDALVAGFPCVDISVAVKQAGIKPGTRSGLFFDFLRIVREHPGVSSHNSGQTLHLSAAVMLFVTLHNADCHPHGKASQADDTSVNKSAFPKLNPEFVEAMMGFPPNWTRGEDPSTPMPIKPVSVDSSNQDYIMRHANLAEWLPRATDIDNIPHRRERLKALGNAVVLLQAAVAWKRLAQLMAIASNPEPENAASGDNTHVCTRRNKTSVHSQEDRV